MDLLTPRHLKTANWVVLGLLVAAGYLGGGREFALGVLVGGLLVVLNFHLLHRFLKGQQLTPAVRSIFEAFGDVTKVKGRFPGGKWAPADISQPFFAARKNLDASASRSALQRASRGQRSDPFNRVRR